MFRITANVVHQPPRQTDASGQFGQDGNKRLVQGALVTIRHAQETGKKHVAGQTGVRAYRQHAGRFAVPRCNRSVRMDMLVAMFMIMRMTAITLPALPSVFLHKAFTTLAAAQAAP